MNIRRLVGGNIRRLRLARGLSQEHLAFEAKLDPSFISEIETGVKSPTITTLQKIANALGVKVAEFFSEAHTDTQPKNLPRGIRKR